mmetsp:Transcript_4873/g.14141  ORF Transcript_4873/g.14141 Transcript_4873/m.14141 type:complete len:152 (+) Transcript_4873:1-456(+)
MHNCWALAASFPLPAKGECEELEDGSPLIDAVSVITQRTEAGAFNAGLPIPAPQGCDAEEDPLTNGDAHNPANYVLINVGANVHRVPHHLLAQFVAEHQEALFPGPDAGGGENDEVMEVEGDGDLLDDDSDEEGAEEVEEGAAGPDPEGGD